MPQDVEEDREAQREQALDQIEGRDEIRVDARIDPAGHGENGGEDPEQEHEDEGPDEIGNGEKKAVQRVDERRERAIVHHHREDRRRAAKQDREGESRERQLERRRQAFGEDREHVPMQRDRRSEIAAKQIFRPDQELDRQACVEAVMRAQRCDIRGRSAGRDHHGDRIAGNDAQENEDDDRDAGQRDGGHGQTIGRAGDHSPREREREREIAPGSRAPRRFHAFDTKVGCSAPVPFGVTLSEDLKTIGW